MSLLQQWSTISKVMNALIYINHEIGKIWHLQGNVKKCISTSQIKQQSFRKQILTFVNSRFYLRLLPQQNLFLTLSWRRQLSYRNQSIDLITAPVMKGLKLFIAKTLSFTPLNWTLNDFVMAYHTLEMYSGLANKIISSMCNTIITFSSKNKIDYRHFQCYW